MIFFDPVTMMWWIIIFTPVWIGCGTIFNVECKYARLYIYRFRGIRCWWWRNLIKVFVLNIIHFAVFTLLLCLYRLNNQSVIHSIFVMLFHSLLMTMVMFFIYLFSYSMITSFICVLVAEILSTTILRIGVSPKFNFAVWGMWKYGKWNADNGYSF